MLYPCNPAVVAWAFYSLFLGCCRCFAKPAVVHCMGANPAVSLLLALACARLCWAASHCKPLVEQAFSVVRKLQFHLQAWGVGREENATLPTLQQDSASLRPHIALGLGPVNKGAGSHGPSQSAGICQHRPWYLLRLSWQRKWQ